MLAIFVAHGFRTKPARMGICWCVAFGMFCMACARAGETFDVKVSGTGSPVILIPGLSCSGVIWDDTVKHLQDRYQCHVLSLKGFGGTAPLSSRPALLLPRVRDEIVAYARGLGHPAIVGHSLGGVLAMAAAAQAPEVPRSLVIVDSMPFLAGGFGVEPDATKSVALAIREKLEAMPGEDFAATQALAIRTMANSEDDIAALSALAARSDQSTVAQALGELIQTDLRPDLAKIKCPVLVLLAGINVSALSADARAKSQGQFASLGSVEVRFFDDARHFIMYDEPERFRAALDAALAGP